MTPRSRTVALIFGVSPTANDHQPLCARCDDLARQILERLKEGQVALLTGPSGGGKSTLLRAVEHAASARGESPIRARISRRREPACELLARDARGAIEILSAGGLGDARAMLTPARELSEGQAHRLALARAMDAARWAQRARPDSRPIVLADEFCSTLDRATSAGVARSFRRWLERERLRAIVASARDEMIELLSPDIVCWQGFAGSLLAEAGEDGRARIVRAHATGERAGRPNSRLPGGRR